MLFSSPLLLFAPYDSLGNILTVSKNGSLIYAYEYDSQNQLTREDDVAQGTSTLFDYDLSGNITARHVFPYWAGCPTSQLRTLIGIDQYCTTISYGYSTGAWGDMLTSYGGTTISYDTMTEVIMMKYNRVIHILSNVQRIHLPIKSMASFMLGEIIIPVASLTSWLMVVLGVLAPKVFEHKIRVYIIAVIFL